VREAGAARRASRALRPFPPDFADCYRSSGFWKGRTLGESLDERCARFPLTGVWKISKKDLRADIAARLRAEGKAS
jgi:non-ribosomal peptide synthetase component E (peptide arylation enzyme)